MSQSQKCKGRELDLKPYSQLNVTILIHSRDWLPLVNSQDLIITKQTNKKGNFPSWFLRLTFVFLSAKISSTYSATRGAAMRSGSEPPISLKQMNSLWRKKSRNDSPYQLLRNREYEHVKTILVKERSTLNVCRNIRKYTHHPKTTSEHKSKHETKQTRNNSNHVAYLATILPLSIAPANSTTPLFHISASFST